MHAVYELFIRIYYVNNVIVNFCLSIKNNYAINCLLLLLNVITNKIYCNKTRQQNMFSKLLAKRINNKICNIYYYKKKYRNLNVINLSLT